MPRYGRRWGVVVRRVLFAGAVALILAYTLFPFYWAFNGALQPSSRLYVSPADYLPVPPVFDAFREVFANRMFVRGVLNSALVAGGSTLLALAAGSFAAYALGRFRIRGRRVVLALILGMTMFPQISILGAVYSVISRMGLYNTLWGLGLSYMILTLPLTVWVMMNFFKSLPAELEESATVDGATPLQAFWHVLLPLSLPGLATTGLLAFITAWNEYLFALALTVDRKARTVPVVIANYTGNSLHEVPWGAIMAASVTVTLPLVVLVMIFQKRIIAGLTAGAVKG
ncbi:MAG: trehalose/maltose transport system permease protein [Candidatus Sumerlaeota bacterium]|nr:trehalose/maltose transport system permease protein [Candidatus Sumerlaeota bacterium]